MIEINNNFTTKKYWYGLLLRDLKQLDTHLTNYLIEDEYSGDKENEDNIITYIKVINDATNFILEDVLEEQDNFFKGDYKRKMDNVMCIHNAWKELNNIKTALQSGYEGIRVQFNKGFNFGIGYCNFADLDIYKVYHEEHCNTSVHMIGVTTHTGKEFRVYVSNDYVRAVYPDIKTDGSVSNKRIEIEKSFDNGKDALGYIIELIQELIYE